MTNILAIGHIYTQNIIIVAISTNARRQVRSSTAKLVGVLTWVTSRVNRQLEMELKFDDDES